MQDPRAKPLTTDRSSGGKNKVGCLKKLQPSIIAITLPGICLAMLLQGGCAMLQSTTTKEEPPPRQLEGAAVGERITATELDELTRGFADRYVGLLYSVCDSLTEDNPDPAQRRAAQILLVDIANNVYDIASNADPFTRVLDLHVVTALVSQVWDVDGRAVAVFGEPGQALADALSQARAEARLLSARVLSAEQLDTLDSLLRDWKKENPKVVRASFVRFSNFALGRGRTTADQILKSRGLLSEVAEARESVDEFKLLAERVFYQFKRASTLLRWQTMAIKADLIVTPEVTATLADVHSLTDQMEQLPANIAAERKAILTGVDASLEHADGTIAGVRAVLDEANTLVGTLKPASDSFNEMLTTADALFARYTAMEASKKGDEEQAFDIGEYGKAAKDLAFAAERMNELLTTVEQLLGSPELRQSIEKVNTSVDGRIMKVSNQSEVVMNAFFWRACALLAVLFAMLILYKVISLLLHRKLQKKGPEN
ncbi:MAG: hypothetical protein ACSLE2_06920 [Lysobacterales bacterium]